MVTIGYLDILLKTRCEICDEAFYPQPKVKEVRDIDSEAVITTDSCCGQCAEDPKSQAKSLFKSNKIAEINTEQLKKLEEEKVILDD